MPVPGRFRMPRLCRPQTALERLRVPDEVYRRGPIRGRVGVGAGGHVVAQNGSDAGEQDQPSRVRDRSSVAE
jgi:hypothetical protein